MASLPDVQKARTVAFGFFVLVPLAFGLLSLALGMDANWDLRNYHYYNAYAFLTGRNGWDMAPAQIPSFYNPTLDLPFFVAADALPARAVGLGLGLIHGLNFIALFAIARAVLAAGNPLTRTIAAALIALTGVTGAGALSEVGTVFWDNVASLGVYGSMLVIIRRWDRLLEAGLGETTWTALLAGLPVGLAFGLKQPTAIFAVGLCAALPFTPTTPLRRIWLPLFFGCGVLAGLAVASGHWMWHLWTSYGNPLFPYFNDIFKSPWALPEPYRDINYVRDGWMAKLRFVWDFSMNSRAASEIQFQDYRLLAACLALPLGLLGAMASRLFGWHPRLLALSGPARFIALSAAITYGLWLVMFAIYRYIIPLEMLAPLLVVLALGWLPLHLPYRAVLAGLALAALSATTIPGEWIRVPWQSHYVSATSPHIENPADTMVLMAGHEPLSFLIPTLPQSLRFIRIDSTFTNPTQDTAFTRLMRKTVADHKGDLAVLYIYSEEHDVLRYLADYGLTTIDEHCQDITSPIGAAPYGFCPLRRLQPGETVRIEAPDEIDAPE